MSSVHFSSMTDEWPTPAEYFARLSQLFKFTLDPCADEENAKAPQYFTREQDGLKQSWHQNGAGAVFMNPPYGRGISAWVKKAYETAKEGTPVVCLLPARTDTRWWQDYAMKGHVEFIRGRLKFVAGGGSKNGMRHSPAQSSRSSGEASFPSAIVIFQWEYTNDHIQTTPRRTGETA